MDRTTLIGLALLLSLCACGTTKQASDARRSGFLGDYSMLREGGEGQALLRYRNPKADFGAYDRLFLEPVTIWYDPDSKLSAMRPSDQQRVADYFYEACKEELAKDYELVDEPGPGVLQVRLAVTEAEGAGAVSDVLSGNLGAGSDSAMDKHTHLFVGGAGAEAEILDGGTSERLMAAVDRRVGRNFVGSAMSWSDVKAAFDHWARRLGDALREERAAARKE